MFIHIGDEHVIRSSEVVSIIDYNLYHSSSIVEEMIFNQRKAGNVVEVPFEEPKAIVITTDEIYFSSLSVATLNKRSQLSHMLDGIEDIADETPDLN
ncbi:extracellular matrix regulator RemB [Alkalibacillus sp. S2W]|uniref:extracellular matrix regulator RemB n=1 Tax=Alkalibacillus TaxID=331654 RepID=UPI00141DA7CF|nr:extracellular matrix/biofilm biosynthesis regulator RemA family protein [Alkalibacillus almallahensis]NIK12775.1 hypothetical protein [Alkalibacillus almallahensis]